jgi:multiple RNA-binding domain-containing protein 1
VHVSVDPKTGSAKGFAFVQFSDPDSAEQAFVERDGQIFQGRLLHILPSKEPRSSKLDDFELSKLPLKKQQLIKKKRESESKSFNWNSLFMNADAVVANVADRLGLSKSEVLDPTSSDAAVRQAHAETHVIQETKAYFRSQGVDLDSFRRRQRGDTAILVKNIPFDLGKDELKRLCEENGDVTRFAIPPSGGIAIVEYKNAAQCKNAWSALSYRRVKNTVLMLEKAPLDVFSGKPTAQAADVGGQGGVEKLSAADLKDADQAVPDTAGTATLFVRNLNFTTTSSLLTDTFKTFEGFMSARVKTKTDPKKPGQILSMGFGFLEFQSASQAQVALKIMDGHSLEGHKLQIRASHRGTDAAEERRKADAQKKAAAQSTKVIIKNLPFEATKKDIRALFGAYGQLRSVRVPQKLDRSTRGFAFADFMNAKEAQNAMESLRDTHLLGRRLVLDFAAEEPADAEAEIEKMQQKVGAQVNKLALQKLTSGGRKKFTTQNDDDNA